MTTIDPDDREVLRRRALDRIAECKEWNATANPPLVALKSDRVTVSAGDLLGLLETLRRAEARNQAIEKMIAPVPAHPSKFAHTCGQDPDEVDRGYPDCPGCWVVALRHILDGDG